MGSDTGRTVAMRSKEEAHDYRYFPGTGSAAGRARRRSRRRHRRSLPELPRGTRARFVAEYGLSGIEAGQLTPEPRARRLLRRDRAASGQSRKRRATGSWASSSRRLNDRDLSIDQAGRNARGARRSVRLVDAGTINNTTAKAVFEKMYCTGRSAQEIVASDGLAQISDASALVRLVRDASPPTATPSRSIARGRPPASASSWGSDEGVWRQGESEARRASCCVAKSNAGSRR